MSDLIDEWGRKVFATPKGRKAKNIHSKPVPKTNSKKTSGIYKTKFARLSQRSPEVMVKISGSAKNAGQLKAHLDYIGRSNDENQVEIEDERGEIYKGREDVAELTSMWQNSGYMMPASGKTKRETFNIVLSMPPGTDRLAVKEAARNFAKDQFSGHQYAFAAHDDEKHPHVHLAVKAVSLTGIRLNPRKADLQEWREVFADKLREQGIAANATRRFTRGQITKGEKQSVIHIDKDFKNGKRKEGAYVLKKREEQANEGRLNPYADKMKETRRGVVSAIGMAAKEFSRSSDLEDKKIALGLVEVVKKMAPLDEKKPQQPKTKAKAELKDKADDLEK
jgi:hypothetical protein